MKRDMDLVRQILLTVAESETPVRLDVLVTDGASRDAVVYHVGMLVDEVGFLQGIKAHTMSGRNWIELQLTWQGQDFLDSVRDATVWEKTKDGALKLGGVSLEMLVGIAKEYAKAEVKKRLGFDL
jgi:hypothetical protein